MNYMNNFRTVISIMILAMGLWLGTAQANLPIDRIIAVVNNDVIMLSELQQRIDRVKAQMREQGATPPPAQVLERQVLDRIIMSKVQLQNAAQFGINISDEQVDQTIGRIAEGNGISIDEFRKIIQAEGMSFTLFREDIREEIIIAQLRRGQVDARVTITDREIDNYLENQVQQGNTAKEYRLSHILISINDYEDKSEVEDARQRASAILDRLRAGEDFAELAASESSSSTAPEGGDLGWRKADRLPSLFSTLVLNMKEGEISELIENSSGFHILKLAAINNNEKVILEQTLSRHILIRLNELTTVEDAKTRLNQLKIRIEGGDDFAELARSHSDDRASAIDGGDLGWMSPGDLVPKFEEQMQKLAPGEISPPFETQFGWHIVQVVDRRQHDSTETIKRAKARDEIKKRKVEEEGQAWLRRLRDEAYVEYRLYDE